MAWPELMRRIAEPGETVGRLSALDGCWVVGGWLRDAWLGRETRDIDLVVEGDFAAATDRIAGLFAARSFELGRRHGSHRMVVDGLTIDISPLFGGSIEADLERRDYTVNALAMPAAKLGGEVGPGELRAHPQALSDLEQGSLNAISEQNIIEDPLRILRGYRLCAELGLRPAPATRQMWRDHAALITGSAGERIHEELLRMLQVKGRFSEFLSWLAEDGVLWQLMPELQPMIGCEQNAYHHLDVWSHTLEAMQKLDELVETLPQELQPYAQEIRDSLAKMWSGQASGLGLLRLALLLHDVDKPTTRDTADDGRVTFHRHQELGRATAEDILTRMKFSTDESQLVCLLVLEHLRLGFYSDHDPLPPKLIYRYIRKLGQATPLALLHALADCAATRGPLNESGLSEHLTAAATIMGHFAAGDSVAAPPVLLNGNEIMELLGVGPGRVIGEVKEHLAEATAIGEVSSVEQAREFVRNLDLP